jgi:CheY-like chemotaxis protein
MDKMETYMDRTMRLLIVDDNPRARRALKVLLSQQAGICVTAEAANGLEALRSINEQAPDIVLMDMRMPVMNGLEATRNIKANWPQIKVVILTMYPDCETEAVTAGADAFLAKGCPLEELLSMVTGENTTFKDDNATCKE